MNYLVIGIERQYSGSSYEWHKFMDESSKEPPTRSHSSRKAVSESIRRKSVTAKERSEKEDAKGLQSKREGEYRSRSLRCGRVGSRQAG
jgi:hypothetical protein